MENTRTWKERVRGGGGRERERKNKTKIREYPSLTGARESELRFLGYQLLSEKAVWGETLAMS